MTDVSIDEHTYDYTCRRCGHEWSERVEIHQGRDAVGEEVVTYSVHGLPCEAPHQRSCPACGGYRVQVLPSRD